MGYTPSFTLLLQNGYDGKNLVCKLNRAVSGKLGLPLKNDEFAIYDFEAEAFADAAGNIANANDSGVLDLTAPAITVTTRNITQLMVSARSEGPRPSSSNGLGISHRAFRRNRRPRTPWSASCW